MLVSSKFILNHCNISVLEPRAPRKGTMNSALPVCPSVCNI